MKYENSNLTLVKIAITKEERDRAKQIAKESGMTFQCWLAGLVKKEIPASSSSAISLNTQNEEGGAFVPSGR